MSLTSVLSRTSVAFTLFAAGIAPAAQAQPQVQFKANMQTREGADGVLSTGTFFLGSTRTRMELLSNGETFTIIVEPVTKTQYILMTAEKMYMEMPLGAGPVRTPRVAGLDPTNPCSDGSGTGCVRVGPETVNGYQSVKWEYVSDGEKWTSWVATRLRFPIKMVSEKGSMTEFSNVMEGNQPASLFAVPTDYSKMDMGAMNMARGAMRSSGAAGRGAMGAGRVSTGDPAADLAALMASMGVTVDPAAIASAVSAGAPTPTGSAQWASGDGWIVNLTVTASGRETLTPSGALGMPQVSGSRTYSGKYVASIPLNYGAPGVGTMQGPTWTHLPSLGSPAALATPMTMTAETNHLSDISSAAICPVASARHEVITTKGSAQARSSIAATDVMLMAQAMLKLSGDLKTYDLTVGISARSGKDDTETTTTESGCGNQPDTKTAKSTYNRGYSVPAFQLTGLPLPATRSALTGTRTVTLKIDIGPFSGQLPATVQWSIVPIGGR